MRDLKAQRVVVKIGTNTICKEDGSVDHDYIVDVARQVVKDFAGRVMHLLRMVEDLSLRSVEARLARLLLELAEGEVVQRRRWATQADLAARLGTVPDVVNRALRKLAAAGLIHVERQQIQILDGAGLRVVAQVVE